MNDAVFIVLEKASNVEEYDSDTFTFRRSLELSDLTYASDMTSSAALNSLFISDWTGKKIHKLQLNGRASKWSVGEQVHGLSMSRDESKLLATCDAASMLKEFSARNGELIREIRLPGDVKNPFHAIELSSGNFVVSHGDHSDRLNRVVVVDARGQIVKSYGNRSFVNVPVRLAVDVDGDGSILTLNIDNPSVLFFSPMLGEFRERILQLDPKFRPRRMWLDRKHRRVFIAAHEKSIRGFVKGKLMMFQL